MKFDQTFQQIIVIYTRGNFVYYYWRCTSNYRPLSYPFIFFTDLIKEYIMKHANGIYQCMKCGYESSYNTTIKRHVEARHFTTPGVPCDLCHVVCKTSNALTTHRSKFHHKQTEKIQNVN